MKLIIDISEEAKRHIDTFKGKFLCGDGCDMIQAIQNGTPLDSNSDRAEVQAYFAGQTYGWKEGRKALIDDVKAKIEEMPTDKTARSRKAYIFASEFKIKVLEILNNIGRKWGE